VTDIAYKLLTQDQTSYGDCKWEIDEWKETSGEGSLCSHGWLHFYSHPLLAMLLNPIHANFDLPTLWEAETDGQWLDDRGLRHGVTHARITRRPALPVITTAHLVRFAILCALECAQSDGFRAWAARWLRGGERTYDAAYAAYAAYAALRGRRDVFANAANAAAAHAAAAAAAYAALRGWRDVFAATTEERLGGALAAKAAAHTAELDLIALAERAIAEENALDVSKRERP